MMIRDRSPERTEPRILKVRLPTEIHLQLHSLKILTGKSISVAVEEALASYFRAVQAGRADRGLVDGLRRLAEGGSPQTTGNPL